MRDHGVTTLRYTAGMSKRPLEHHYLREWRNHRGLSLRKLADRMEIEPGVPLTSHANIDRIEKFQQPYTQEIMESAADALGTTVAAILTVNPKKEGAVVDLLDLVRIRDPETVRAILTGLPEKTGTNG